MRTVDVYLDNMLAGQLFERNRDDYEFAYNVQYLADSKTPAIALSLPKREKPYRSSRIFPFFTNLLPEGSNRKAICAEQILSDSVNASDCQLKEPSGYRIFLWSFRKRLTI